MHPVLFDIKGFKIYTYGPIMALGFLCAFALMYHLAKKRGEDLDFYMDLYLWLIIFGLLGAKLLYNLIEYEEFLKDPIRMMNCRNGGLVWYGGVLLDTAFVIWYARRRGYPVLQVTDTLSAPLALGLAIGRWGCLMGGCCYGKPCHLPWAITYPPGANPVAGIPVHPSPIYESIACLIIAGIIYSALNRGVRTGVATVLWFSLYSAVRFLLEFLRGDEIRGFVYKGENFALSTSQFIGILVFSAAMGLLVWIMKNKPTALVKTEDLKKETPKEKTPSSPEQEPPKKRRSKKEA